MYTNHLISSFPSFCWWHYFFAGTCRRTLALKEFKPGNIISKRIVCGGGVLASIVFGRGSFMPILFTGSCRVASETVRDAATALSGRERFQMERLIREQLCRDRWHQEHLVAAARCLVILLNGPNDWKLYHI